MSHFDIYQMGRGSGRRLCMQFCTFLHTFSVYSLYKYKTQQNQTVFMGYCIRSGFDSTPALWNSSISKNTPEIERKKNINISMYTRYGNALTFADLHSIWKYIPYTGHYNQLLIETALDLKPWILGTYFLVWYGHKLSVILIGLDL